MKTKTIRLPPRTKFRGWDYIKWTELRMTGREWHEYAKRETFKTERGADAAWGNKCEVWFDNKTGSVNSFTEIEEG